MDIRFTDPAAPLFIDVEGDSFAVLFVISTSQVQGMPNSQPQHVLINRNKREHEEDNEDEKRFKKPMKAVRQSAPPPSVSKSRNVTPAQSSMPRPSPGPPPSSPPQAPPEDSAAELMPPPPSPPPREPLFFPSSSQITHNEDASDLGLDQMTADDVDMMLDGNADESMLDLETDMRPIDLGNDPGASDMMEEQSFGPTQSSHLDESKVRTLFVSYQK